MSNNVTLPGTGNVVETLDTGSGVERQVVTISPRDLSAGDSIGALTETAPATDTASSGLNGRLQRIAQNLTTLTASTIKVDGSAVTQPVSGTVSLSGTSTISGTVTANQGGTWNIASITNPVAVTGTFWQATQPVSGTFWQATQPVSIASMPTTPVTGTFWQATQPVSGTVTANQGGAPWTTKPDGTVWTLTGTSANVNVTDFPATQAVTQSGTWTTGRTWQLASGTDSINVGNFPASQTITGTVSIGNTVPVTTTNAALETGGNLATAVSYQSAMINLLTQILMEVRALRLQDSAVHGQLVDPETNDTANMNYN